jgi:hypothetical protein
VAPTSDAAARNIMKNAAVCIGNIPFLAQIRQTLVISAVLISLRSALRQRSGFETNKARPTRVLTLANRLRMQRRSVTQRSTTTRSQGKRKGGGLGTVSSCHSVVQNLTSFVGQIPRWRGPMFRCVSSPSAGSGSRMNQARRFILSEWSITGISSSRVRKRQGKRR